MEGRDDDKRAYLSARVRFPSSESCLATSRAICRGRCREKWAESTLVSERSVVCRRRVQGSERSLVRRERIPGEREGRKRMRET